MIRFVFSYKLIAKIMYGCMAFNVKFHQRIVVFIMIVVMMLGN